MGEDTSEDTNGAHASPVRGRAEALNVEHPPSVTLSASK